MTTRHYWYQAACSAAMDFSASVAGWGSKQNMQAFDHPYGATVLVSEIDPVL